MKSWSVSQTRKFLNDWRAWGRWDQLAPRGPWRTWLFLGGRGAGKTKAGAEWISFGARTRAFERIALIGPTFHDVREVMIEGRSGVRAVNDERPSYEASRRRLVWSNGAHAYCFSAEDPESLRGPQFDAAWCDELAYWSHPDETMATLAHGLRLGERPRLLVTTTPRPIAALKALIAANDVAVTRASTWDNANNLAPGFIAALEARWTGSVRDRQEILGKLIEDPPGALWTRAVIDAARIETRASCERVVVAVDPPVSAGSRADRCGIVAAGLQGEGFDQIAIVLADASVQGLAPMDWAARVAALAHQTGADTIVAEANNGGELVRAMLSLAAPGLPVRLAHARIGKKPRAEPVAMLYAQGRVKHAAVFPELEDEMCAFGAPDFKGSSDRLDALVWAITELLLSSGAPRLRAL